jgi:Domain of unknown function (DUF4349)
MESHRDDLDLAAELRALRPTPRPAFAAALDSRAAAGFPRSARLQRSPVRRAGNLLRAVPARRLPALAGACAVAAIAIATAVVATSESGRGTSPTSLFSAAATTAAPPKDNSSAASGRATVAPLPSAAAPAVAPNVAEAPGPGPYAPNVAHRDVERSAQIVLGAEASEVRSAAAKVFETVQAYHGIVLSSSISDGAAGEAGASFELLIPSGRLDDAMAAFSAIAEVRSRHESTADVTAPTIGLGERLRDARARVSSLLAQLAGAETEVERKALEAKLRSERRNVAALQARLTSLRRRTHLSGVSLRIETGGSVSRNNGWGVDRALGDAGHILSVAAGVSLVGLAILVPPVLICLLAWLARRTWIRRRREHALG